MPKNEHGFTQLLLILLLLVGVGLGAYLVTQRTTLFSKASQDPIVFKDSSGIVLPKINNKTTTINSKVSIEFTSTLGPPSNGGSGALDRVLGESTENTGIAGYFAGVWQSLQEILGTGKTINKESDQPFTTSPGSSEGLPGNQIETLDGVVIPTITVNEQQKNPSSQAPAPIIPTTSEQSVFSRRAIQASITPEPQNSAQQLVCPTGFIIQGSGGTSVCVQNTATSSTGDSDKGTTNPSPTLNPTPSTYVTNNESTISFRFAEDPVALENAPLILYTSHPMVVEHTFSGDFGPKFIYVEFLRPDGKSDIKSAEIIYSSPDPTPTATPIPTTSTQPTPTPTSVPTT